jgi:hypothetical protein
MNANDHDRAKRLDEYIDALNAGRPTPQLADDAELADLFATARDLHRLRAPEPTHDDVPSRLAAALERELRANPTHGTKRIKSNDMSQFRDASSNGSLRPPIESGTTYDIPQRPERVRQWAQFAVAAIAFILVGVVLTQIIGRGASDEPGSAVGSDSSETPTIQASPTDTGASLLPDNFVTATVPAAGSTPSVGPTASRLDTVVTALPTHQQVPAFNPSMPSLVIEPDYATCDDTVTAHGVNFESRSTIIIYAGGLEGDMFAPVGGEHSVAEDGTFRAEIDVNGVFGFCGTDGNDLSSLEGEQYRLAAVTSSALSKPSIEEEGPFAAAVLTYSSDVPEGIANRVRLPSCGTEVMLNGTMLRDEGQPDLAARECFAAAVESGALAEFISHVQGIHGDIGTTIYNSLGNGYVDVIVDSTRGEFATGTWERQTCVWSELSSDGSEFQWEHCSEPVTIE